MKRILWAEAQYGSHHGQVGGFRFFSISWTTKRNDPEPWKLSTDLPISLAKVKTDFADIDSAQAAAERIISSFLTRIGAKWIDE